jgi:hypothetical protein
MSVIVFLVVALVFAAAAIAVARLIASGHARASARGALAELEKDAARGGTIVRGTLVAKGPFAARTQWLSIARRRMSSVQSLDSKRADDVVVRTADGEAPVHGPIVVVAGSDVRFTGTPIAYGDRRRFETIATVKDGDEVVVLGQRTTTIQGTGTDYRASAGSPAIEAHDGVVRIAATKPPRTSLHPRAFVPVVVVGAVVGLYPAYLASDDYTTEAADCAKSCEIVGTCQVDTKLRWDGLSGLSWTLKGRPFTCKAHTDADCRRSSECVTSGKCTASNGECIATKDEDCRRTKYCRSLGQCSVVDGACHAKTDADCVKSDFCPSIGFCSAIGGVCARGPEGCRQMDACRDRGECTARGNDCVATTDDECKASESCAVFGSCKAKGDHCVSDCALECLQTGRCTPDTLSCKTSSEADCLQSLECAEDRLCKFGRGWCEEDRTSCATSDACRVFGRCDGGSKCVARSTADCERSSECKKNGACKRFGDECAASCVASMGCRLAGRCTEKDGACVVSTDADCAQSLPCSRNGACHAKDGNCIATDEGCAVRDPCRLHGRCSANGDACIAKTNAECERSEVCRLGGKCAAKGGSCWFDTSQSCANTNACKVAGRCTPGSYTCARSADDCRKSNDCKELGLCSVSDMFSNECVASTDGDCKSSAVCRDYGWCVANSGTCGPPRTFALF